MNKKLSLMMAAFAAAGFSLTAEAGVIKVAAPTYGQQYIISKMGGSGADEPLLDKIYSGNNPIALKNDATGVNVETSAPSAQPTLIWTVAQGENGGFCLQSGGKYLRYYSTALSMDEVSNASSFKFAANKVTLIGNDGQPVVSSDLTIADGSASLSGSGTNVDFYAVTKKYLSETTSAQVVKIFGKYLVVTAGDGTTDGKVALVDEAQYNAYKTLNPANVTWTIDGKGALKSSNGTIKDSKYFLSIAESGGVMTLTMVADANKTTLEYNKELKLFGYTKTSADGGEFVQWTGAATGVVVNNSTTIDLALSSDKLVDADAKVSVTPAAYATSPFDISVFEANGFEQASSLTEGDIYLGFYTTPATPAGPNFVSKEAEGKPATAKVVTSSLTPAELAAATWTFTKTAKGDYTITRVENGAAVKFTVGTVNSFFVEGGYDGFYLYYLDDSNTKQYVKCAAGVYEKDNDVDNATYFTVFTGKALYFKVSELNYNQGNNFTLDIVSGANEKALQGNFFDGRTIVAVVPTYATNGKVNGFKDAAAGDTEYMLRDAQTGEFIVLDMYDEWSAYGINQHITDGGYKFTTIKEAKTMINYLNHVGMQNQKLEVGYMFKVAHTPNSQDIKFIEVSYDVNDAVNHKDMVGLIGTYYLVNYNSNGNDYLTVNKAKQDLVKASFGSSLVVTGDMEVSPFAWRYVNVSFANNANVVYYAESGKYVALNGKVMGMSGSNPAAKDEAQFLFDKPEGQWAVLVDENQPDKANFNKIGGTAVTGKETQFVLVNRENPAAKIYVNKMYKLATNKYAIEYANGSARFANWKEEDGSISSCKRDTMIISATDEFAYGKVAMDGYSVYTTEMLKNKLFRLALNSTVDDYYVGENHGGNHLLGLVRTSGEAVNWELVPMTKARELDKDGFLKTATDSVYVINHSQNWNAAKNRYDQTIDTLAMVPYVLKNTANGEYLRYEGDQTQSKERMMCDPNSKNAQTKDLDEAYRFVLKQKDGEILNILGIKNPVKGTSAKTWEYYTLDLGNKLFGATTETRGSVEVEGAYAQINSNDRFYLELVNADQYKTMALNDTVRIYRDEYNYDVMYENGQFLNLANIVSEPTINPAMLIDTAYVVRGENNTRPQYLLVVNPNYVPAVYDSKDHLIEPDTMYGRFLVNQIDSAVWENKNGKIHNNKFINDTEADETYVKLGFQYGFHTGDKLYLTDKNFVKTGKASDVIDLSTADFNRAKFAFKYVNPEAAAGDPTEAFKIQTRYIDYKAAINGGDSQTNEGYLKTINGVVVVTDAYDKGEEFNMTAEVSNPTANEGISTSEVSVIAGDAKVIIKGAAGKTVVISNLLGQTIANEAITSDNAEIAAPAGVVVVAVEGEAAVKAIVK